MFVQSSHSSKDKKYIFTCVAPQGVSTQFITDCQQLLTQHCFQFLSRQDLSEGKNQAIGLSVLSEKTFDWNLLKPQLMILSQHYSIDWALIPDDNYRLNRRLIVCDMDSTLINAEVIDELAIIAGVGDKVKTITARAMNGELNFDQSLSERVALLKGLKRDVLKLVHQRLPLNPGVASFIKKVKALGYKTAIVTGGFNFFTEDLRHQLKMDYAFANELEFSGDELTGRVIGTIVNADRKASLLEHLAQTHQLELAQTVAIGDGANDIPMLMKAGLGVAFHAKEKVRQKANFHLSFAPMSAILYYLGVSGRHFDDTP